MTSVPLDFVPQDAADWKFASDDFEWYAARFICIADKNADEPHPLFLNDPQKLVLDYYLNERNSQGGGQYLILKARQMGKSTLLSAIASWLSRNPGFKSMTIAHDNDATLNLLSMIKLSYNALDPYWQLPSGERVPLKPMEKASNRKELHVVFDDKEVLESRIMIQTAGKGEGVGRSFALNFLHLSEVCDPSFDDGTVVGAVMQTLSDNAVVFAEGTANGAYGWFYEQWLVAKREYAEHLKAKKDNPSLKYNGWVPIFVPWFRMQSYSIPLDRNEVIEPQNEWEQALVDGTRTYEGYQVSPEQLKWVRWIKKTKCPSGGDLTPDQWFDQEYPSNDIDCFIMSGSTYFPQDVIAEGKLWSRDYLNRNDYKRYDIIDELLVESPYGPWRFLRRPDPSKYTYTIGGDVAEGLESGDYDTAIVIELRESGPNWVIGYWRDKEDLKPRHAEHMMTIGNECGTAKLAIENNLHGIPVNNHMWESGYGNLYISSPDDEGSFATGIKKRYGFSTTAKTKGLMLGELQQSVWQWHKQKAHPDGLVIPWPEIWDEMGTFTKTKKKVEAASGKHDDLVMALGIANHVAVDSLPKRIKEADKVNRPSPNAMFISEVFGKDWKKQLTRRDQRRR